MLPWISGTRALHVSISEVSLTQDTMIHGEAKRWNLIGRLQGGLCGASMVRFQTISGRVCLERG
ncbi:hypothetical protein THIOKS11060017 [Thiocapsa sp. KS1]|nr:hypothetical protein THIOKS11060017 [Thiocapsa sp. KS1]